MDKNNQFVENNAPLKSEIDLNNDDMVVFDDIGEFDSAMLRPMQED
tara:strand:+ start:427 stop:564 length:138 start_codon:yes stop_codon:yes gene_type:complete